ncbi:MAG: YicC family protein [Clostridiales bacterium]|nr:YicC family protein [Clostridiales bacterium]
MRSMTGYGRFSLAEKDRELSIELKSVNHRYLDLNFRLPRPMQFIELTLRKKIGMTLSRGHVDIILNYQNCGSDSRLAAIDVPLAVSYYKAAQNLKKTTQIGGSFEITHLMNLPEVIVLSEGSEDEEVLTQLCMRTLEGALAALLDSREQEGEAMRCDLGNHMQHLEDLHGQLSSVALLQPQTFHQRLTQRLEQLVPEGIDEGRLELEVALLADKVAVDEELARLAAHIDQMNQLLDENEALGRKMDFLSQEMNREVNTIGSKSNSLPITRLVLEMKNTLEKVREQIQNVE